MSLEDSPARAEGAAVAVPIIGAPGGLNDPQFWHQLIDEREAAIFLGVGHRMMQTMRQRGDGPLFVFLSSRCVKYRRTDLREYAEARLRRSTADTGPEDTG